MARNEFNLKDTYQNILDVTAGIEAVALPDDAPIPWIEIRKVLTLTILPLIRAMADEIHERMEVSEQAIWELAQGTIDDDEEEVEDGLLPETAETINTFLTDAQELFKIVTDVRAKGLHDRADTIRELVKEITLRTNDEHEEEDANE